MSYLDIAITIYVPDIAIVFLALTCRSMALKIIPCVGYASSKCFLLALDRSHHY